MGAMVMAADMEARSYYLFNDGLTATTEGHPIFTVYRQ